MKSLLLCMALLSASPRAAQEAAPAEGATAVDQGALEAALRMFEGMDIEAMATSGALQMADAALLANLEHYAKDGEEVPQDLIERVRAVLLDEVKVMIAEMMPTLRLDMARIYARHFTRAEIEELTRLQANPVMKKMEQIGAQLQTELASIGMRSAVARKDEIERKVAEVVSEWAAEQEAAAPTES